MKTFTILTTLILAIIISSCSAQKKIAQINNNSTVTANSEKFLIRKNKEKVYVENASNRLSKIKQISPNLPLNFDIFPYIKIDFDKITKICSKHISIKELEVLSKVKNSSLFIRIRSDVSGKPIEIEFFTDANSVLNIEQLNKIERELLNEKIVVVKPEISKYLVGSNFLVNDAMIYFDEIIKYKNK